MTMLAWTAQASFLLLLFLLFYVFAWNSLHAGARRHRARYRLEHIKRSRWSKRLDVVMERAAPINRHLSDIMELTGSRLQPGMLLLTSLALLLAGWVAGALYFLSVRGMLASGLILGSLPYLWYRLKWMNLRLRTRLDFLPSVEVFYQMYVLNGGCHVRNSLNITLAERRFAYPIGAVFDQLYRNLTTGRTADESLRLFSLALGHNWANAMAGILRIGLTEGIDISRPLGELIQDMRKAQRADQADRNRLLEIRIANFTPIAFLAVFLIINAKINPQQAYHFYVLDPVGRNMLLDSLLLIFASFLMGMYLSMKRM
jgi:Flp pilus assembly protein TadB